MVPTSPTLLVKTLVTAAFSFIGRSQNPLDISRSYCRSELARLSSKKFPFSTHLVFFGLMGDHLPQTNQFPKILRHNSISRVHVSKNTLL
jgi:hypothetical protein